MAFVTPLSQRLRALGAWMAQRQRFTAHEAAARFGVSVRTVRRDVARLRAEHHVPVVWNAARRTFEVDGPVALVPPLVVSGAEFAALLVAEHALAALGDAATAELLAAVQGRLAEALPASVRVPMTQLVQGVRFAPSAPQTEARAAWHLPLQEAIDGRHPVVLRYRSASKDEVAERTVEPYLLVQRDGRWYVVAYCQLRDDWRDFRLDRIEMLEVRRAASCRPRPFDADAYLQASLGMHRGDPEMQVHVRFSAREARWVAEETWHPSQVTVRLPDGRLDVRLSVAGLPDVVRWLLGYGAEVEVLAPRRLRAAVAEAHRAAAARYARDGDPARLN